MQLSVTKKRFATSACLLFIASIFFAGCHRANSPGNSPVRVSLCELYQHPATYDGKLITVRATATRLPNGTYLYPGPSRECTYVFVKLVANHIQNDTLSELESTTVAMPGRKEFDPGICHGPFDVIIERLLFGGVLALVAGTIAGLLIGFFIFEITRKSGRELNMLVRMLIGSLCFLAYLLLTDLNSHRSYPLTFNVIYAALVGGSAGLMARAKGNSHSAGDA